MGLADREEAVPKVGGNNAAAIGSKPTGLEIERAKKVARWVGHRYGSRVGNKFGEVGGSRWGKKVDVAKFHDIIGQADEEAVPLGPPAAGGVSQERVGRVLQEKVDMIEASQ
jgi:hypothetical protein